MFFFNPITLFPVIPFSYLSQNIPAILTSPLILEGINFNDGQSVVGGIIIGSIITLIPKMFSYFKHRYDTSLKTSYDIDKLFEDYAEISKSVDEGNIKNDEIKEMLKNGSKKMDDLINDNKRTRSVLHELSKIVYDHDEILYERRRYKANRINQIKRNRNKILDNIDQPDNSENNEEN